MELERRCSDLARPYKAGAIITAAAHLLGFLEMSWAIPALRQVAPSSGSTPPRPDPPVAPRGPPAPPHRARRRRRDDAGSSRRSFFRLLFFFVSF